MSAIGDDYAAAKSYCKVFEMAILEGNQCRPSFGVLESDELPSSNMPDVIRASLKRRLASHIFARKHGIRAGKESC